MVLLGRNSGSVKTSSFTVVTFLARVILGTRVAVFSLSVTLGTSSSNVSLSGFFLRAPIGKSSDFVDITLLAARVLRFDLPCPISSVLSSFSDGTGGPIAGVFDRPLRVVLLFISSWGVVVASASTTAAVEVLRGGTMRLAVRLGASLPLGFSLPP